jgi:serine/threonine-protein kinase RsbW/stage II sporulation protein AB (anti-sigma F factor)
MRLAVAATPRAIASVRNAVVGVAERAGAAPQTVAAVRLAVSEAATNAVRHAYDEGKVDGEIRASARVEGDDRDVLVVAVCDDGPGLHPRPDSPGMGLGLPLIAQSAESIDITNDDPGLTVCMRFALP